MWRAGCLLLLAASATGCRDAVRAIEKSMEPAIRSGDLVRVDEHAYDARRPRPGEIVALVGPRGAERDACGVPHPASSPCPRPTARLSRDLLLIKRVVAGPGARVAIRADGRAVVDGRAVTEPYVQPCRDDECALPRAVRVPPRHYFVLGDNRPYSSDSRFWGPVPRRAITGRVTPSR